MAQHNNRSNPENRGTYESYSDHRHGQQCSQVTDAQMVGNMYRGFENFMVGQEPARRAAHYPADLRRLSYIPCHRSGKCNGRCC